MRLGFFAVVEFAGTLQNNVTAGPVQLVHVVGREHLHVTAAQVHGAFADGHVVWKTTVHAVILQQVGCSFQGASGIDLDHFDIVAARGCDMRQSAAPDAAEPVDPDFDGHVRLSKRAELALAIAVISRHQKCEKVYKTRLLAQNMDGCGNENHWLR